MAIVLATSCVNSDIDDMPIISAGSKGELQVVGRVTQYSDCDVATRSKKEGDEPKVTSMGLALFPIENGTIGNCLYYDFKLGGSIVFIVDRHDDVFKNYDNTEFAMYIFANMQDAEGFPLTAEEGKGKSLDYFKKRAVATTVDVENVPANGFPMMGLLGGDGVKTLVLKPTAGGNNVDGLPTINGTPTDNLEIPLRSMYAKFTFTIAVKPDQEIVGNKAPRFDLLGYTVSNLPSSVDSDENTNSDNAVIASSDEYSFSGKYAQGATTATFDFYLPERYLTPTKSLDEVLPPELKKGTYDKSVDDDQNGYRDEDEKYHQRYKNKMVDGKAATYITFYGKYTDHQGHTYDVNYNIYLGGNNCDNFDVIRNTHYNNSITIRGISTSNDQATNTDGIAIDWRVDVERSTPLVINLRRESLLDAHFEVRPLRLRLVGENIPTGTSATVTILNEDGTSTNVPSWIRLETSGNSADHITSGVSAGKRKYFTTDLVTNTLAGNTEIDVNNLTGSNQTLWIYVDENTDTKSRAALVRISYDGVDTDFKVVQNGLYAVKTTRNASIDGVGGEYTYYIEQYEEYLHNYDAEDSYGQTEWNGMEWGLNGVELSSKEDAFVISHITGEGSNIWDSWGDFTARQNQAFSTLSPKPYYDFYLYRDILSIMGEYFRDDKLTDEYYAGELKIQKFNGHTLNKDIADLIKEKYSTHQNAEDNINYIAKIDKIALDQTPKSAYAYCYNRNKRQSDGTVKEEDRVWYLPAVDEIEDIVEFAQGSFEEFQNNLYWSCQPAYIFTSAELQRYNRPYAIFGSWEKVNGNIYYGSYFSDDTERARATKAERENGVFKEAPSSGADQSRHRTGNIYISAVANKDTEWNTPTITNTNPYHQGNLSRTGTKARVRCVRKM